jgi:hypothetical protein
MIEMINGQFWENSCRNNIDKKTLGVDVLALNADDISVSSSDTSVSTAVAVHVELLDMVKIYIMYICPLYYNVVCMAVA